jgi:hypothetical protein
MDQCCTSFGDKIRVCVFVSECTDWIFKVVLSFFSVKNPRPSYFFFFFTFFFYNFNYLIICLTLRGKVI